MAKRRIKSERINRIVNNREIDMNEIIKNGINNTGTIDNILNVDKRANYLNNKIKRMN